MFSFLLNYLKNNNKSIDKTESINEINHTDETESINDYSSDDESVFSDESNSYNESVFSDESNSYNESVFSDESNSYNESELSDGDATIVDNLNHIVIKYTNHQYVINEINDLKNNCKFGIKKNGEFIDIPNSITINNRGALYYTNFHNEKKTVASFIKNIKNLQSARWLNHLYYRDYANNIYNFKKRLINKYSTNFT